MMSTIAAATRLKIKIIMLNKHMKQNRKHIITVKTQDANIVIYICMCIN